MGTLVENTAPEPALGRPGGFCVSDFDSIINYKAAISVFKNWLEKGLISEEELMAIDTMLTNQYGISSCSIYREKGCYVAKKE